MKCLSPQVIKNPIWNTARQCNSTRKYIVVPCGKCYACRNNYRDEWTARIFSDVLVAHDSYFVTLTYDESCCPEFVEKSHVQKFLKRLRNYIDSYQETLGLVKRDDNNKIVFRDFLPLKYACVSEYGEKFSRPHYHMILNNVYDVNLIANAWPFGFIKVGSTTAASIKYTLKYILDSHDVQGDNFAIFSKGIGMSIVNNEQLKDFFSNDNIPVIHLADGNSYNLPRYVKNKWDLHYQPQSLDDYLADVINNSTSLENGDIKKGVDRFNSFVAHKNHSFNKFKKHVNGKF